MSLWGSFTGSDAKRALDDSYANSNRLLQQGQTRAADATTAGFGEARGYLSPYTAMGGQANALYANHLGLNGADAQRAAMAGYAGGDPFREWNADQSNRMISRSANAEGWGGGSGPQMLAMSRANLERGSQDYNNWLTRLAGMQGQGFQAAGALSGLASGEGNALASIYGGFAQQNAANAINYGNAKAANSNIFANNLLGLGGLAVKAFAPGTTNNFFGGGGGGGGGGGYLPGGWASYSQRA